METKDAILLEVLARSSQRDGFMKMAASPELGTAVRDRFEKAEAALKDCSVSGTYIDHDRRSPWQIVFMPGHGIGVCHTGGGSYEHWSLKPTAVLLEAFISLPAFELMIDRHRRASSSTLLQAGAAAVAATGETLPLLPTASVPVSEVSPEEAQEILSSTESEPENSEDIADIVEALVSDVAVVQPQPSPAVSEESRLAEEILGKLGSQNLDITDDKPLPPLKGKPLAKKAAKKPPTKSVKAKKK